MFWRLLIGGGTEDIFAAAISLHFKVFSPAILDAAAAHPPKPLHVTVTPTPIHRKRQRRGGGSSQCRFGKVIEGTAEIEIKQEDRRGLVERRSGGDHAEEMIAKK